VQISRILKEASPSAHLNSESHFDEFGYGIHIPRRTMLAAGIFSFDRPIPLP
jgi:hypothetical protein